MLWLVRQASEHEYRTLRQIADHYYDRRYIAAGNSQATRMSSLAATSSVVADSWSVASAARTNELLLLSLVDAKQECVTMWSREAAGRWLVGGGSRPRRAR